jgi:hypothetical protein
MLFLNPRMADVVLGLMIGMGLALVYHWTIR